MNCKPGDLAVAIKSEAGNEGRIMTCIRFLGSVRGYFGDDYWEVDRSLPGKFGNMEPIFRDSGLRPIRDPGDDATDETLLWCGAPTKEVA